MKNLLTLFSTLLIGLTIFAQSPESFKYQAVVRDSEGVIITDQSVGLEIQILEGSINGAAVYAETHNPTTNSFGLINLNIGEGTIQSGIFETIDWGNDNYFLKVSIDISGGTSYTEMGTSQLLSVPYSLYSKSTDNYNETDPIFTTHDAYGITGTNITDWNTAFGWGDHSTAGYLTSYTETDPIYTVSPAAGIFNTHITNWNTAYGWGDHNTAGYLTSEQWSQNGNNIYFNTGNVGIGATNPSQNLHIDSPNDTWILIDGGLSDNTGILLYENAGLRWNIYNNAADNRLRITDIGNDNGVYISQGGSSWAAYSDEKLKENIETITNVLDKIDSFRGVKYNWKNETPNTKKEIGIIAQEIETTFPELVSTDSEGVKGLSYDRVAVIAIQAIKELKAENEKQKLRLNTLENRYLVHSFVESPDMMNIYNGNAILNGSGEAIVKMPDWFEANKMEFRYQLTPIGAPGPNLYIKEKIKNHQFIIAGGTSGMEVSWQITGKTYEPFDKE